VGALALAALAWQLRWWAIGGRFERSYYGTDMRAYQLLFGCTLACAWRAESLQFIVGKWWARPVAAGGGLSLVLIATRTLGARVVTPLGAAATVASGVVIIALVESRGALLRVTSASTLQQIAQVSYGIYLWNFFFLGVFGWKAPAREINLALSFLIPILSFRLIEMPFLRLKSRFADSPTAPVPRSAYELLPTVEASLGQGHRS
jgi:peptidoglycan/LPS O-acetylase OafA/YrhL